MTIYFNESDKNIRGISRSYLKRQIQVRHCRCYEKPAYPESPRLRESLTYPITEKGNFSAFSGWGSGTRWEGSCGNNCGLANRERLFCEVACYRSSRQARFSPENGWLARKWNPPFLVRKAKWWGRMFKGKRGRMCSEVSLLMGCVDIQPYPFPQHPPFRAHSGILLSLKVSHTDHRYTWPRENS